MFDWNHIVGWSTVAAGIVAILTLIYGTIKGVKKIHASVASSVTAPIIAKIEEQAELNQTRGRARDLHIEAVKKIVEKHIEDTRGMPDAIKRLEKELHQNGGSSIPDKISKVLRILENQGSRFLALHQDNPQGIFLSDTNGECTWVNTTLLRICGCSEGDMLGWSWLNQIVPEEVDEVRRQWSRAFVEQREYKRMQTYLTTKGARVKASVTARPVWSPSDKIIEWVGFVHELSA